MYDELVLFLASFLIWGMFAGLIILWFIDGKIRKEQVVHALFATFIAWTAAEFVKRMFMTPRPFDVNHLQTFTLSLPIDPGFPSAHAAIAFSLAVTIFLHDKKVGYLFLIMAILVGWARVAANVHFPVDIIGGAIIGAIIALVIEKIHIKL